MLAWTLVALSALTYSLHRPSVSTSFAYHWERASRVLCVSPVLVAPASVLKSLLP
ncbi:hypothetical protein [Opitutus terrae]|nr:hypothetical protein [Opitutus terrae]